MSPIVAILYAALAVVRNPRRLASPLKSLIVLAMAMVAGARPAPIVRRSSTTPRDPPSAWSTKNTVSYLLSIVIVGLVLAAVIPGANAMQGQNPKRPPEPLQDDRQAPSLRNIMAPGIPVAGITPATHPPPPPPQLPPPTMQPGFEAPAFPLPVLPVHPPGTVTFTPGAAAPLQTPTVPPPMNPAAMLMQPGMQMQMLQMLHAMLSQAQGMTTMHGPNGLTPNTATTSPVPFQGYGTTPIPAAAPHAQPLPQAQPPAAPTFNADPAAAGPSDPALARQIAEARSMSMTIEEYRSFGLDKTEDARPGKPANDDARTSNQEEYLNDMSVLPDEWPATYGECSALISNRADAFKAFRAAHSGKKPVSGKQRAALLRRQLACAAVDMMAPPPTRLFESGSTYQQVLQAQAVLM